MRKIKYLFKRIIELDYKNMFRIAKNVSKKSSKNIFFIIIDMIYCGFKYQAGYYDYQEFEFYNLNKNERKTYLTRGINNEIIRKYNNKDFFHLFESKEEFNKLFNKYLNRDWLILKDYNEFSSFFKKHKKIIVKPIDSSGGQGVEKYQYENEKETKTLYKKLKSNNQLLIEEFIKQHKELNSLYDKSVNTMRMYTFFDGKKSHFLQAILKIGNGDVIDNFSKGGMYTFVSDEGKVLTPAIDREDNIYFEHPLSNKQIVDFKVPMFKEAVELVKKCSAVVQEIKYVGWDVAISDKGPVIVEGNCFPGVYQIKASLSTDKQGLLPKYKKVMKDL